MIASLSSGTCMAAGFSRPQAPESGEETADDRVYDRGNGAGYGGDRVGEVRTCQHGGQSGVLHADLDRDRTADYIIESEQAGKGVTRGKGRTVQHEDSTQQGQAGLTYGSGIGPDDARANQGNDRDSDQGSDRKDEADRPGEEVVEADTEHER